MRRHQRLWDNFEAAVRALLSAGFDVEDLLHELQRLYRAS